MKYIKGILAAIFGLSPAAVVGILALFKIHVDETTVTYLIGILSPILATLGVVVGPKNQAPESEPQGTAEDQIQALWAQHARSTDPATLETPLPQPKS